MFLLKDPKEGESTLDYIRYDPTIAQSKVLGNEKSYIILNKLKPPIENSIKNGESLHIEATPCVGIAKMNSSYCPTGTVSYSFKRDDDETRIHKMFRDKINQINQDREMKGIELLDNNFTLNENKIKTTDSNILTLWNSFQILDRDRIYLNNKGHPNVFSFVVESIGSVDSRNIVYTGLDVLKIKLIDIAENIDNDLNNQISIHRTKALIEGFDITIRNENHTVGNLMTHYLQEDKDVLYAVIKCLIHYVKKLLSDFK